MSAYTDAALRNLEDANGKPLAVSQGILSAAQGFALVAIAEQLERIADRMERVTPPANHTNGSTT
jgi:hypothetical protein